MRGDCLLIIPHDKGFRGGFHLRIPRGSEKYRQIYSECTVCEPTTMSLMTTACSIWRYGKEPLFIPGHAYRYLHPSGCKIQSRPLVCRLTYKHNKKTTFQPIKNIFLTCLIALSFFKPLSGNNLKINLFYFFLTHSFIWLIFQWFIIAFPRLHSYS